MPYTQPKFVALDLGTIDYKSGQSNSMDIPRNGVLAQINLRAAFTITTDAASDAVSPLYQTLARFFRKVSLTIAGQDTVVQQRGESLAMRAQYEIGTLAFGMGDAVGLTKNVATAYNIVLPIPFFLPRSRNPFATAIDLRGVSQVALNVDFCNSNCSDFFGTPQAGAAVSATTVQVEGLYLQNVDPKTGFLVRDLREITGGVTQTTDSLAVTIDGGTGLRHRSIALAMLGGGNVANVGSDGILNKASLISSSETFYSRKEPMIRGDDKNRYGLESRVTGAYFLPVEPTGDLAYTIQSDPSVLPADLKAILDVTTPGANGSFLMSVEAIRPAKF